MSRFKDLEGHWAQERIERLVEKGIVKGYSDGTMNPEGYITRAEAFTVLARALEEKE